MHWSLTGITGCGKSRLLKEVIIPTHRRAGRWVGVLDPLGATWPADWSTNDPMRFVAAARASRSCVWVVDEFRHFAKNWDALMELEYPVIDKKDYKIYLFKDVLILTGTDQPTMFFLK